MISNTEPSPGPPATHSWDQWIWVIEEVARKEDVEALQ